jgi:hypothetical protein
MTAWAAKIMRQSGRCQRAHRNQSLSSPGPGPYQSWETWRFECQFRFRYERVWDVTHWYGECEMSQDYGHVLLDLCRHVTNGPCFGQVE